VFAVMIVHATDCSNRCTRPPASCDATRELSPGGLSERQRFEGTRWQSDHWEGMGSSGKWAG